MTPKADGDTMADHLPGKVVTFIFTDGGPSPRYEVSDVQFGWAYCKLAAPEAAHLPLLWINLSRVTSVVVHEEVPDAKGV